MQAVHACLYQVRNKLLYELFQRFAGPDPWELFDEVLETLETLQGEKVRMVVISNWDDRLPVLLEGLGLAGFFEAIVFSASS